MNPPVTSRRQHKAQTCALMLLLSSAAAFMLIGNADSPLAFEIVRIEQDHAVPTASPARDVAVRLSNPSSNNVYLLGDQKVQLRIGGRWQPPEICRPLSHDCVGAGRMGEDVILNVPPGAEACRFLLEYRVGSRPYCKAYFFLERHGIRRQFPQLSKWVLKQIAAHEGPRRAAVELMLPNDI